MVLRVRAERHTHGNPVCAFEHRGFFCTVSTRAYRIVPSGGSQGTRLCSAPARHRDPARLLLRPCCINPHPQHRHQRAVIVPSSRPTPPSRQAHQSPPNRAASSHQPIRSAAPGRRGRAGNEKNGSSSFALRAGPRRLGTGNANSRRTRDLTLLPQRSGYKQPHNASPVHHCPWSG